MCSVFMHLCVSYAQRFCRSERSTQRRPQDRGSLRSLSASLCGIKFLYSMARVVLQGGIAVAFPCPHCGDRNTQSLAMVHESGTYVRNWRSRSGYFGTTVSQSLVGMSATPPRKRRVWLPLFLFLFTTLWFGWIFVLVLQGTLESQSSSHSTAIIVDGKHGPQQSPAQANPGRPSILERLESILVVTGMNVLIEGPLLWWLFRNLRFNRQVFPRLLETWQSQFMCRQCGLVFQP